MDSERKGYRVLCVVALCLLWPLFLLLFLPLAAGAQQEEHTGLEERLVEELMELLPEDQLEGTDWSDFLENLAQLRADPRDLNKVSLEELGRLGFLSPLMARRIVHFREMTGGFISINELQAVEGMDLRLAHFLAQFFYVGAKPPVSKVSYAGMLAKGRHELLMRYGRVLQKQIGYQVVDSGRSRYLGSPDRLLLRYRYGYGPDLKIAVNMEKDAGEQFFAGSQLLGFDFYGGSIQLGKTGPFALIVFGDYVLQFGQGLGMWSGYAMGKGAVLHGIAKQGMGLKVHTSADESAFLRGVSAVLPVGRMRLIPFVSYRRRDAQVLEDSLGNRTAISLGQSGLHRSPTETAGRSTVSQFTYGLNAQLDRALWRVGGTVYHSLLDADLAPQPLLRNQYRFSGRSLVHGSVYYQANIRNLFVFGETAHGLQGGGAMLHGVLLSIHQHVSLALLHRYYQRDHHTFYGNGFGENSDPANERGLYAGLLYQPNRRFSWVLYQDVYHFPWLRYRVDAPSYGRDLTTQFSYSWSKKKQGSLRVRYQEKQENQSGSLSFSRIEVIRKYQFRLHFETGIGKKWLIRSRLEQVLYTMGNSSPEYAWMVYQDVFYQPMGARISGNLRLACFRAPSYDSRIYAYENDMLYSGAFSAYYQQGWRTYLNMRCRLGRFADLWLRYALTLYRDTDKTGSGLDQSDGPLRSDVKLQFRIRIP